MVAWENADEITQQGYETAREQCGWHEGTVVACTEHKAGYMGHGQTDEVDGTAVGSGNSNEQSGGKKQ
jgi:hypothetical protein